MEFKHIEINKEEYSRLIEFRFKNNKDKKELIHFLADFTLKIYETCSVDYKIFIDEDIENIYFEILSFIENQDYYVPKTLEEKAHSEKLIKNFVEKNLANMPDDELEKWRSKPLIRILEFRNRIEGGIMFNKRSIGYEVFLEFKRKILNKQKTKTGSPKRLPAPVIMAMLKELGVFAVFNRKGFGRNGIVDTLYQIIGTDKTNIGKYYDSLNSNNQIEFNESHIKKAKEFLNSKGL